MAGSHDYFDGLLEILVDCTTLLEYQDRLFEREPCPELLEVAKKLLYHCLLVEDKLIAWYNDIFQPSPEWSPPTSDLSLLSLLGSLPDPKQLGFNISEPLQFSSFKVAQAHLLYWTGLVLLYPIISRLLSFLGVITMSSSSSSSSSNSKPWEKDMVKKCDFRTADDFTTLADHSATQICRSAAYCLQARFKAIGPQTILSPLWAAQQFFLHQLSSIDGGCGDGRQAKYNWCVVAFGIVNAKGLGFASRLAHLPWSEYPKGQRIVWP